MCSCLGIGMVGFFILGLVYTGYVFIRVVYEIMVTSNKG